MDAIQGHVDANKEYPEKSRINFFGNDYNDDLKISDVDMIISQYAGFVGQATKKYLKKGGILLSNDSHGDATLAFLDDDFEFIGVIDHDNTIDTSELDDYFRFSRPRRIGIDKVYSTMKGPKYKLQPANYIFKLKDEIK